MRDKVLEIVKIKGPVLPLDVSKALNLNSILAGAYLSELLSHKLINLSYLKVGGSPVYYVRGQESKLQNFISALKGPEKIAVQQLKEKKVLKDSELEPVLRVALQNSKDFAKPIEITLNNGKNLYWKWYLTTNEELKDIFTPKKEPIPEPTKSEIIPEKEKKEELSKEEIKPEPLKDEPKEIETDKEKIKSIPEIPKIEPKKEVIKEKEIPKPIKEEPKSESQFELEITKFLEKNNIGIISKKVIRNDSEIEYQVLIPSAVGKLLYCVVAKSKKRCSDADLSQLYVKAEMSKLPALFIHSGELTKKAKEMLKHEFKIITTYKLDL